MDAEYPDSRDSKETLSSHALASSPQPARCDRLSWCLGILALISALTLCLLIGFRRETRLASAREGAHSVPALRYGERLPDFRLTTCSGRALQSEDLQGKWTLLVFFATWCPPCADVLKALARLYDPLKSHVQVVAIAMGGAVFASPRRAALRYRERNQLPFDIALDPDEKLGTACGAGAGVPHAVLAGPDGTVRFVTTGSVPTARGSVKLIEALEAFFLDRAAESIILPQWEHFNPAPDAELVLRGGQRTRLKRLSPTGTLVLTFLTGDVESAPLEMARIAGIRRFNGAPGVRFLFVAKNAGAKPLGLGEGDGMLVAEQNTAPLFRAYGVDRGPVSVIIHRGRGVLREAGPQASGAAFEDELAYAVLLSGKRPRTRHDADVPARSLRAVGSTEGGDSHHAKPADSHP